jgi:hypothetical protein
MRRAPSFHKGTYPFSVSRHVVTEPALIAATTLVAGSTASVPSTTAPARHGEKCFSAYSIRLRKTYVSRRAFTWFDVPPP